MFLYTLIQGIRTRKEQAKLADKIKSWIDEHIENIQKAFARVAPHSEEARLLSDNQAEFEKIQKIWDGALKNAARNSSTLGTIETDGGVQFSVKENNQNSSIREQIKNNLTILSEMKSVAEVNYTSVDKKKLYNLVDAEFSKIGYKVDRKNFGEILIGKKQINTSLNYINTNAEKATFLAVPKVLKRGTIISDHSDHKGRSYGTVTIAAPVSINGTVGYMGVVVKRTTDNKYHTHRILMPDGSEFLYKK